MDTEGSCESRITKSRIRPSTRNPYRPHKDAAVRFKSAVKVAQFVAGQPDLHPSQQREFRTIAVWKTTGCHGKCTTRYRSAGAVTDPIGTLINHEHVLQGRCLVDRMIEHPTKVKEILDFGPGSIVELKRLANEPVDILVNGVLVARGEVVVIEDHFGVRLTSLISPEERIRCLGGNES